MNPTVIKVWLIGSDAVTAGSIKFGSDPVIVGLNNVVDVSVSEDCTIIAVGNHA